MRKIATSPRAIVVALIAATGGIPWVSAAPLNFVQYPAGAAYKTPTPNVIVSVDNSGSMATVDGGQTKPRMTILKETLVDIFKPDVLPDKSIRLAYQAMFNCLGFPSGHTDCNKNGQVNTMKLLEGTADSMASSEASHRGGFMAWVNTLGSIGGNTPSHSVVRTAGEYLKTTGATSPWNDVPGTTQSDPLKTCRRSYHIFLTDGEWNAGQNINVIGNADGTDVTLPDGAGYSTTSDQTRVYRDGFGTNVSPTLSDMAFHYWSTDLQPAIANETKPLIKRAGSETFTSGATSSTLDQYWNPKNNPATWQHLTTYTIGFGPGANWTTAPVYSATQGTYGGDFAGLVTGGINWRNAIADATGKRQELWHMALNSRGQFYSATGSNLKEAFKDIFATIFADNASPTTSFTSASGSVSRVGTQAYSSGYSADGWTGYVLSNTLAASTGNSTPNLAWGINAAKAPPNNHTTSADKLDALANVDNRVIISYNDETAAGVAFDWKNGITPLSAIQQAFLNNGSPGDGRGEDRVQFLRGDRSKEQLTGATGAIFRDRKSRQGDIVNSSVWFTGVPSSGYGFAQYRSFSNTHKARVPMLYVGGNDGMLHGFSAVDGSEKIAYVPQGVYPNLRQLTVPSYTHRYYVDGSPFTGDVNLGDNTSPNWRTFLAGTLGAGGKGFFILDVTTPGTTDGSVASNFAAASASSLVVLDKTDGTDADLGHIFGKPVLDEANPQRPLQITRTNNNRWALITGNGYSSVNERPVLYIQYLDGAKEQKKLEPVPNTNPKHAEAVQNGLSTPQLVDINADGIPDVLYAGDLRGNLWKFDISNSDASQWGVAFGGSPLFRAELTSGNRQPITVAPVVRPNRQVGGMMVAFGTGRDLEEDDRTDVSLQTIYSVHDNTLYAVDDGSTVIGNKGKVKIRTTPAPVAVTGRSQLMRQNVVTTNSTGSTTSNALTSAAVSSARIAGTGLSSGRDFWALGGNVVDYATQKGWYFDLPEAGERVLTTLEFFDGSGVLEIMSEVPASGGNTTLTTAESCEPSPRAAKPYRTLLNIERGSRPQVQVMDTDGNGLFNAADQFTARMTASPRELRIATKDLQVRKGSDGKVDKLSKIPELMLRPGWRQLK